jgi:hypothetical protein
MSQNNVTFFKLLSFIYGMLIAKITTTASKHYNSEMSSSCSYWICSKYPPLVLKYEVKRRTMQYRFLKCGNIILEHSIQTLRSSASSESLSRMRPTLSPERLNGLKEAQSDDGTVSVHIHIYISSSGSLYLEEISHFVLIN